MASPTEISASAFKAKCLQILDDVASHHHSVVVTKHGKPVARLVPIEDQRQPLGRSWEGSVKVHGDLLDFDTSLDWETNR